MGKGNLAGSLWDLAHEDFLFVREEHYIAKWFMLEKKIAPHLNKLFLVLQQEMTFQMKHWVIFLQPW